MPRDLPVPTESEWIVLHALWRQHPATARELLEAVGKETGWAYTTLKTILTRMEEKGLVKSVARGRSDAYEPRVERGEAQRKTLTGVLERVFEGAAGSLLSRLVDTKHLTSADRKKLEALLEEIDRRKGGATGA
jgi:BlaI family penicillinase repressor